MSEIILFYVPCPSAPSAQQLVQTLIEERVIACGNVVLSDSCYLWEGSLQSTGEHIALMKTLSQCRDLTNERIKALHPYDVPAILSWRVDANDSYIDWVRQQVKVK